MQAKRARRPGPPKRYGATGPRFRCTASQRALIAKAAALTGETVSDWVRETLVEQAELTLMGPR